MRKPVITKQWLAEFYAEGVKPKYRGSVKHQASKASSKKRQASSQKLQAPSPK
jgi:hypothetical protein